MKAAAAALVLLVAAAAFAKPPTVTCEPGFVPECVPVTPTPAPPTPTIAPPTPTRTPTAAPTATPPPVSDTEKPKTWITSPQSGQTLPAGTTRVTAAATDNVAVSKVEFYYSGSRIGTVTAPPFEWDYNLIPGGATIQSRAYDAAGNVGMGEVNVTVSGGSPTPTPPSAATPTPTAQPLPPTPSPTPSSTPAPTVVPTPGSNKPIPPLSSVDTSLPPATGSVISVRAGQSLQAALDAVKPGEILELEAGATWTGRFILRAKTGGTGKVWIRSSAYQQLPPPGARVSPADAPKMPKIVTATSEPALLFDFNASNYYLSGLEIAASNTSNAAAQYGIITLGYNPQGNGMTSAAQLAKDVIFDRVYIHGTPTGNCRRGIALNSASTAVIGSYIADIHEKGADSQAIAGWNGPGPFLIENNYLEGAGENVMFGGSDAAIQNLVPSDITFRLNHVRKNPDWKTNGLGFVVKNSLELKNAQRMVIEGNVFDRHWPAGQQHYIVFTVRNQGGSNPWATVQDIRFANNEIVNPIDNPRGVNLLAYDGTFPAGSQRERRIEISNNLFANYPGDGIQVLGGPIDLVVRHNTQDSRGCLIFSGQPPASRMIYTDNLCGAGNYGVVIGDGVGGGCQGAFNAYAPDITFTANEFWGPYPTSGGFSPSMCNVTGATNYFPASEAAVVGADYRQTSAVHNGTDGTKIGADIDAIKALTAGVVQP